MNNPNRNHYRVGIVDTDQYGLAILVGRRTWPVIPHEQIEIRGTEKTKVIGLIAVLVWSSRDARQRHRDVRHDRMEFGGEFVMPKQFAQPATSVVKVLERLEYDSLDRPIPEHALTPSAFGTAMVLVSLDGAC